MKNYWLCDNNDIAKQYATIMLQGLLEYHLEEGIPVTAEKLLERIELFVQEEEARLNASFPDKASGIIHKNTDN